MHDGHDEADRRAETLIVGWTAAPLERSDDRRPAILFERFRLCGAACIGLLTQFKFGSACVEVSLPNLPIA